MYFIFIFKYIKRKKQKVCVTSVFYDYMTFIGALSFLYELKLPCEVICFYLEELPLAFLIMWLCQQQNLSALDYLRNSTSPSFLKYRFTGYRILVNRFSFFFFLSAPYKCYPIAFWPSSFLLKSLLPKLKELPLSDASFFS